MLHEVSLQSICTVAEEAIPNLAGLEIDRCTRKHSRSHTLTRLTAVHDTLGNGREVAASFIS